MSATSWATSRCIASTRPALTWRSAASGRCSSPIRPPRSPTSPPPFDPRRAWCCSSGSDARTTNGRGRSTPRWATRLSHRRRVRTRSRSARPKPPPASSGGAGFDGIRFEDVHEPVLYGHDVDAALAFVRGFQDTSTALANLSDDEAARTVERLRETLAAHYIEGRGVVLDSRSWLITARRRRHDVDTWSH